MRKIIAWSLIAIVVVNIFGYLISFGIQNHKIKEDVERTLEQGKNIYTQQFVFSVMEYGQLHFYENGKELSIEGSMYDVVRKELKDGKVFLTVCYDNKETGLLNELASFFTEERLPIKHKYAIPTFSLLEFVFKISEWKSFLPTSILVPSPFFNQRLFSLLLDIACPPPDTFLS